MELIGQIAFLPPIWVWGLLSRGLGLVFLISFASMTSQVVAVAGKRGLVPVDAGLRFIERDFPTWKRFVYFPTLLWLGASDPALLALSWLGVLSSALVVVGGPFASFALFASYVVYVSLDRAMVLVYPWDCVLLEAGFWGAFLPATHTLPSLTAVAAPDPAVAWVFRLLVFRVMFGFGKHKFVGATDQDAGYLKGFFINQPLPSVVGYLSNRLPMWALKGALLIMFVAEIPGPFTVFFPGWPSALGGLLVIGLMVAIWAGGTFGFFNLILIVLAVSWFDSRTALAFSWSAFVAKGPWSWVHALILLHTAGALLSFPLNSFCANSWLLWPVWLRVRPALLTVPMDVFRALHPLRWLHTYGVFPPHSLPPAKMVPTIEVTWDEKEWHPLEFKYWPVLETSRPKSTAPHQSRLDQAVLYEAFGVSEASVIRNFMGRWEPYGYGRHTGASLLMRAVLEGDAADGLFGDARLSSSPSRPVMARARSYLLEPTPPSERKSTGKWWKRTLVGPHLPPMRRRDSRWDHSVPPPELWHPEDVIWLRRSHFGPLMKRALDGESPHELVLVRADDFGAEDVRRFWDEFIAAVSTKERENFEALRTTVDEVRRRFTPEELYRFERIAGRYALLLAGKLEPRFLEAGILPALRGVTAIAGVKTHFHLRLLAFHVLSHGRATYDEACRSTDAAFEHGPRLSLASGSFLLATFSYESFVYQAQKLRGHAAFTDHAGRKPLTEKAAVALSRTNAVLHNLWGTLDMVDFLRGEFTSPEHVLDVPENWPHFRLTEDDEVVRDAEAT